MFMGRLTLTAALSRSRAKYVAFCLKSLPTDDPHLTEIVLNRYNLSNVTVISVQVGLHICSCW